MRSTGSLTPIPEETGSRASQRRGYTGGGLVLILEETGSCASQRRGYTGGGLAPILEETGSGKMCQESFHGVERKLPPIKQSMAVRDTVCKFV